jgi:hypothetical protein
LGVVPQAAPELLKMTSVAQGWSISYHSTSLCEKSGAFFGTENYKSNAGTWSRSFFSLKSQLTV